MYIMNNKQKRIAMLVYWMKFYELDNETISKIFTESGIKNPWKGFEIWSPGLVSHLIEEMSYTDLVEATNDIANGRVVELSDFTQYLND